MGGEAPPTEYVDAITKFVAGHQRSASEHRINKTPNKQSPAGEGAAAAGAGEGKDRDRSGGSTGVFTGMRKVVANHTYTIQALRSNDADDNGRVVRLACPWGGQTQHLAGKILV